MASKLNNVFYLAFVRVTDAVIVASYGQPEYGDKVRELVAAPAFRKKAGTGQRMRIKGGNVAYNFTGDAQGLAVLAVTASSYPERVAFTGLIDDACERFMGKGYMWSAAGDNSLSRKFKGDMAALCKEYDDINSKDKIARLRQQVAVVQTTMQSNIAKAIDNLESTERLEEQSQDLLDSAQTFERSAKKLACKEWCMLMKMRLLVVLVVLVIIGIIVGVICGNPGTCDGGDDGGSGSATPASS